MKKSLSIKYKIAFALSLFSTLTMGALAGFILVQARQALVTETTNRGILIGRNLASYSANALLVKDTLTAAGLAAEAMKNEGMAYAVLTDEKGVVLADGSENLAMAGKVFQAPQGGKHVEAAGLGEDGRLVMARDASGEDLLAFSFPVLKNKIIIGNAYIALSQSKIQKIVGALTRNVILLSGVFLAIGFLGAAVLAALIVRPVSRLTAGAIAIGRGEFDTRIALRSRDEFGILANSFNEMASNLKMAQEEAVKRNLLERDLSIARDIQSRLLPKSIPKVPGWQISGHYQPAQEVGGDYYDVLELEGEKFGLVVADVSGKGVPGSLGMAMTRSEFRLHAFHQSTPSRVLSATNQGIYPEFGGRLFVSMFYAVLDSAAGKLRYASAGHNPAYLVNAKGVVSELQAVGPALGLFPPGAFKAESLETVIKPGEVLVLYTDGIVEATNSHSDEYGDERFKRLLSEAPRKDLEDLRERIIADVTAFEGETPQHDDITLLMVRREK